MSWFPTNVCRNGDAIDWFVFGLHYWTAFSLAGPASVGSRGDYRLGADVYPSKPVRLEHLHLLLGCNTTTGALNSRRPESDLFSVNLLFSVGGGGSDGPTATVSGAGSTWTLSFTVDVGGAGSGR